METDVLTFGSLFSGIGGLDLGLEWAGWTCLWQVENDAYCSSILRHHWPTIDHYGDVKDVDWHDVRPVDLVAGGFPCQPVSRAGWGRAQSDHRWLWPWFRDALRVLRPRFALVENVPGLLYANEGRAAQEVFGDLAELGYDTEWTCLSAAAVGAPHVRSRLFIAAYPSGALPDADGEHVRIFGEREGEEHDEPSAAFAADHGEARDADRRRDQWRSEPAVGRVAHGLPRDLARDQHHALGNAVVPQVAEVIGRRLRTLGAIHA